MGKQKAKIRGDICGGIINEEADRDGKASSVTMVTLLLTA